MEHVFSYLAHPEHLPRYAAPLWMAADLPEKRGSTHLVTLRGYFIGLPVEAVVKVTPHHPSSLDLVQIHGTLRAYSGRFSVRSVEGGSEILYHVETDPGIPMLSDDAARQFLVQHVERLLDRLKLAAERKTPSSRPRAAAARPAAAPAGTSVEAAEEEAAEEEAADETAPLPATRETTREMTAPERPQATKPSSPEQPQAEGGEARPPGAPSGHRRRRRRRRRRHSPSGPGPAGSAPSAPA